MSLEPSAVYSMIRFQMKTEVKIVYMLVMADSFPGDRNLGILGHDHATYKWLSLSI